MTNKVEQAVTLLNQNKINKALQLIKKVNKNSTLQSFRSLEIEGICLFHSKKYPLAEIVLKRALVKAQTVKEKCTTLMNLKSAAYKCNKIETACLYLKQSLAIDPSIENIEARLQLCELSFDIKDHNTVIDYTPKLLNSSDYYIKAIFLLLGSYIALSDNDNSLVYCQKAISELDNFNSEQNQKLIDFLFLSHNEHLVANVLSKLELNFGFEAWFEKATAQLSSQNELCKNESSNQLKPTDMVVGEDHHVVKLIRDLIDHLKNMGARFNEELRIVESNGELSIQSYTSPQQPEELLSVPLTCMPLLADYQMKIVNDELTVINKSEMLNPLAAPVMESLKNIYNSTNKFVKWTNTYPLLTLKNHPKLVELLLSSKLSSGKLLHFKRLYDDGLWDDLLLASFFGSREFTYMSEYLANSGINTTNKSEKGLLSIIDFINHKTNSAWYSMNTDNNHIEIIASPDPENREVFVQYNISDPVITYLLYGFVDTNAPWLYSVPNELETLSGLKIIILNNPNSVFEGGSNENQLLDKFMPSEIKRNGLNVLVSSLIIPNLTARNSLPQVLQNILKKHDVEGVYSDVARLENEVRHIEKQLLINNLNYWKNFSAEVNVQDSEENKLSELTRNDLHNLCDFSIEKITSYMSKKGISLL